MVNVSVKRITRDKFQQEIEDHMVSGWKLKNQNDNVAIMTKPGGWGSGVIHVLLFLFTSWWTLFIGNIIYAAYAHYTSGNELQIKIDE